VLDAVQDGMLQSKAKADAGYFASKCGHAVDEAEARAIEAAFLRLTAGQIRPLGRAAPAFRRVLSRLTTENQGQRIRAALAILQ
jgi:hypothetical protein